MEQSNNQTNLSNNWTDLHPDFDKKNFDDTTYKQSWQQLGFTKSEAKEWINIGFAPYDYNIIKEWKSHNFTPVKVQLWLVIGLNNRDHHFASWLRTKGYTPKNITDLFQSRIEFDNLAQIHSQQWLEQIYPYKNIKELYINNQNLTGSLNLNTYQQLEELYCSDNHLTNLDLSGCQELILIDCSSNQFPNFNFLKTLPDPEKIIILSLHSNPINQTLDFLTPLVGLELLELGTHFGKDITNFHGSLSPLSNCQQLKELDITNTNLNSDVELLPPNLKIINAYSMTEIEEKLKDFKDKDGGYNYQSWKQTNFYFLLKSNNLSRREKNQTNELDFSNKNLTGELDLSEFAPLQSLNLSNNFLTNIVLPTNTQNLSYLDISNNNFSPKDLSIFRNYSNLETLKIGTSDKERIKQQIYNRFYGSLEPLQNLTKLKELNIDATDIDSGLRYINENVKFSCESLNRKEAGVKKIRESLNNLEIGTSRLSRAKWSDRIREREEDIFLNLRIKELEDLINRQWEKIYSAYLYFAPQKELLEELIKTHVKFTEFKKQESGSSGFGRKCREYNKKCENIKDKLWEELNEEEMDEIETILKECEEIVNWQSELAEKQNTKNLLLEGKQTNQPAQIHFHGPVNFQGGQPNIGGMITYPQEPFQFNIEQKIGNKRQLEDDNEPEIIEVSESTSEQNKRIKPNYPASMSIDYISDSRTEQKTIETIQRFLQDKRIFLTTRQSTIQRLKDCYDKLDKSTANSIVAKVSKIADTISGVGEHAGLFGMPTNILGGIMNASAELIQDKRIGKHITEFQLYLANDKKKLEIFRQQYKSFINDIPSNHLSFLKDLNLTDNSFNDKYNIFYILNTWLGKSISGCEEMEQQIKLLTDNLQKLNQELDKEEKELREIIEWNYQTQQEQNLKYSY